jgi:hypothetical protein
LIHSSAWGGSLTTAQASIRKTINDFDMTHLADCDCSTSSLSQNADEELIQSLPAARNYWPIRDKNRPLFRAKLSDDTRRI